MTRINVVPVEKLHRTHLVAEYKEITRVYGLVRKQLQSKKKLPTDLPRDYTLGTGHVKFFYNKLGYITNRYNSLVQEMVARGYNPNPISINDLSEGIDSRYFQGYTPTPEACSLNIARLIERNPEEGYYEKVLEGDTHSRG
jgi:deoxyribonuclease (pyrimidine dimer)